MSATKRNLAWLRREVCRLLNVDIEEPDQAFSSDEDNPFADIDDALNEAYDSELEEAKAETDENFFMETLEGVTWEASEATLKLPTALEDADLLRIDDITNTDEGVMLWVQDATREYTPEISWRDRSTLVWNPAGPGSDTDLRFTYMPSANELAEPLDEPTLIPAKFRWLLVWTAGILMRSKAGDDAPVKWEREQAAWRMRFWGALSKGRPRSNRPAAQPDPSGGRIR